MAIKRICILGGSGFVGSTLANRLSAQGYQLRVLTRHREQNRHHLILLPNTEVVEADVHNQQHLVRCFEDCDVVINLVGILNESGRNGQGFHHAHVALVEKVINACRENQIDRILHMSALNADAEHGPSHYLTSKGQAEDLLFAQSDINVTCFRPSVIFGRHDSFFNRFADLLSAIPLVFPLACPNALFAPVFVEDVAECMLQTLNDPDSHQQAFEVAGPQTFRLIELVRYTAECLGIKRTIIPLNDLLSRIQAAIFNFVPGKPFSTDNYLSCKRNSVTENNALARYDIHPTPISAVVPGYLGKSSSLDYDEYRRSR